MVLGRVNHIALAVPDLSVAIARYENMLGAKVSARQVLPEHGVTVVFVDLGNTKVELLEALGEASPIAAFMSKNPSGGMHHICYEVADIQAAKAHLIGQGARVLGDIKTRKTSTAHSLNWKKPFNGHRHRNCHLFCGLVDCAVCRAAIRHARPG
jgi:methylmalonyl-CoA/ethylmalonyl-CoA epimerase